MKLERNGPDGVGKYAVVKMAEIAKIGGVAANPDIAAALRILEMSGLIDYDRSNTENEFFVLRLKDKYSLKALMAYKAEVEADPDGDPEYAQEIVDLAWRAGTNSPWCKRPD